MADRWMSYAVWYASDYGWSILPLHPRPGQAETGSEDPVERQLGHVAFGERSEASSDPEQIRAWEGCTDALVGVVTGTSSDLIALEVPTGPQASPDAERLQHAVGPLPETATVLNETRKYLLYTYPEDGPPLPPLSRFGDVVLHGDRSLIAVPGAPSGSPYEWDIRAPDTIASAPSRLLALFGHAASDTVPGTPPSGQARAAGRDLRPPTVSPHVSDRSPSGESQPEPSLFRTGEALRPSPDEQTAFLGLPWLVEDGMTLLTGRSKTAGTSTWSTHLAAAVAGGTPFLGHRATVAPVVLLTDRPPTSLRALLQRMDLAARDALARLHVLHPKDVADRHWRFVIHHAYDHARNVGARLVVVDSLEQYVYVKGDAYPVEDEAVAHLLTGAAPQGIGVVAVTSLPDAPPAAPMSDTVDRLGLLARTADLLVRMDAMETPGRPTLRCVRCLGRGGSAPATLWCELTCGRYQRVRMGEIEPASPVSNVRLPIPSDLRQSPSRVARHRLQHAGTTSFDGRLED